MRDPEPPIAKVRNKLQPIVTYFYFLKMLDNKEIEEEKVESIKKMVRETYNHIQTKNMEELLLLIKNDNLWI